MLAAFKAENLVFVVLQGLRILDMWLACRAGIVCKVLFDSYFLFKNACKYFAFLNIMCIFARNKIKSILNICLHLLPIKSLWTD